jgi:hypothetical protein
MRQLSIITGDPAAAEEFRTALADFDAEVVEEDGGYRVRVLLERGAEVPAVLTALRSYVTSSEFREGVVELDGTHYLLHDD